MKPGSLFKRHEGLAPHNLTSPREASAAELRGLKKFFRENWGAPFVIASMLPLVAAAVQPGLGMTDAANNTALYAFYALVLGVALQIVSHVKYGPGEEEIIPEAASPPPSEPPRTPIETSAIGYPSDGDDGPPFGYPLQALP